MTDEKEERNLCRIPNNTHKEATLKKGEHNPPPISTDDAKWLPSKEYSMEAQHGKGGKKSKFTVEKPNSTTSTRWSRSRFYHMNYHSPVWSSPKPMSPVKSWEKMPDKFQHRGSLQDLWSVYLKNLKTHQNQRASEKLCQPKEA